MPSKKTNSLPKPNPYLTPISVLIAGGLIAAALFINKSSKPESEIAANKPAQNQEQTDQSQPQTQSQSQDQGQVAGTETREDVETGNSPLKGNLNAPVIIVEFSEFQCPYCRRYAVDTLPQIIEKYVKTGKVKYAFRNFPLSFHKNAPEAAGTLLCSREQGKFWEMHDLLFEKQSEWADEEDPTTKFGSYAKELGINISSCLSNGETAAEIQEDFNYGQQLGVNGVPAFFINGRSLVGAYPFEEFEKIIEEELSK